MNFFCSNSEEIFEMLINQHGRLEGGGVEHGNVPPPPEIGKNCRNLMLFSKALFLATTFPEIVGKSFFRLSFLPKISKYSENFLNHLRFSSKREKIELMVFKEF